MEWHQSIDLAEQKLIAYGIKLSNEWTGTPEVADSNLAITLPNGTQIHFVPYTIEWEEDEVEVGINIWVGIKTP